MAIRSRALDNARALVDPSAWMIAQLSFLPRRSREASRSPGPHFFERPLQTPCNLEGGGGGTDSLKWYGSMPGHFNVEVDVY